MRRSERRLIVEPGAVRVSCLKADLADVVVVLDLVVIPDGDHGCGRVQSLQVWVGPIQLVLLAVLLDDLWIGDRVAPDGVAVVVVLIDVVAEVHEVVKVFVRHGAVGVVVAARVVGARADADLELLDGRTGRRRRPSTTYGTRLPLGREAVPIPRIWIEARHRDLGGVVVGLRRLDGAALDDVAEVGIGGDVPVDREGV